MLTPVFFNVGKKVEDGIAEVIREKSADDAIFMYEGIPLCALFVLKGMSQREISALSEGKFIVGVSVVNDIPFLVLDFGRGMSFEIVIPKLDMDDPNINAMKIIGIESNDLVVKSIRAVGLDPQIVQILIDATKKLQPLSVDEVMHKLNEVYARFDTAMIMKQSKKFQLFEGFLEKTG